MVTEPGLAAQSFPPEAPEQEAAAPERNPSTWAVLRPLVLRLHFYAGVFIAPFLVIAALTGMLYVFTPQLEQAFYAHELHVPAAATTTPLSEQIAVAQTVRPGEQLQAVRPGATPTDTTQVIFKAPDLPDSYQRTVFIDPHTTEIRGDLVTYGSGQALPLRAWIDNLHRGLHLGDTGRLYSELAASWLWVVVLGGVALWIGRPRRNRRARSLLAPELRPAGRRRVLSWHGAVGLWAALGLLFLSATGLTWSVHAGENVTAARAQLSWETPAVTAQLPSPPSSDVGIDRVHQAALGAGLDGQVEITPPEGAGSAYTVQQQGRTWPTKQDQVAVDPSTGTITETVRFADYPLMAKLARWGVDAHMGLLFGLVNQLLLVGLMLALLSMIFWGYRMWWLRRPTRGDGRIGRPPERGVWRRIPGRIMAPIIVGAAFVAYFLPLLGASLLVFLVVDIVLGSRARRSTGV
ncbi:PepSY domain-containing protein [Saccharopolyspora gloriosae]|uniref:PepSY-associated TM helix domain-containing protein n=1 Tax=Saccharopolyspora gloriosae TaxID=455344 RepID=UPI001FB72345|nr:PepSY domain-containing protein [Saccharopolyspora gloriosae]